MLTIPKRKRVICHNKFKNTNNREIKLNKKEEYFSNLTGFFVLFVHA
jgi:hypothetical protein